MKIYYDKFWWGFCFFLFDVSNSKVKKVTRISSLEIAQYFTTVMVKLKYNLRWIKSREAKIRINTKINMRNYWEGSHTIDDRALANL